MNTHAGIGLLAVFLLLGCVSTTDTNEMSDGVYAAFSGMPTAEKTDILNSGKTPYNTTSVTILIDGAEVNCQWSKGFINPRETATCIFPQPCNPGQKVTISTNSGRITTKC